MLVAVVFGVVAYDENPRHSLWSFSVELVCLASFTSAALVLACHEVAEPETAPEGDRV